MLSPSSTADATTFLQGPSDPLSKNDIESELSDAYLHAVASKAGVNCSLTGRHLDNRSIDAQLTSWGPFTSDALLHEVDLKVQLKSTTRQPADKGTH
jgi:hypothetical protein